MPPETREAAPDEGPLSKDTDVGTSDEAHDSPTVRYLRGREAVLGHRVTIPLYDPVTAAEAICEALGGRQLAGAYVRQMLAELPPCAWPVDPDGNRFDYPAVYGEAAG